MAVKLGNIITNSDDWFGREFMVLENDTRALPNLPTLYIGYLDFKEKNPDVSILEFKYSDNIFWTFSKKEDRNGYVAGLIKFKEFVVENFLKEVTYIFVDPYELSLTQIKEIINSCMTEKIYTFFYSERMIYISVGKTILGLDLELLSFIGININKLLKKINSLENNSLLNSEVIIKYSEYLEIFDNQIKLIPYLYSLDGDKKKTLSNIRT